MLALEIGGTVMAKDWAIGLLINNKNEKYVSRPMVQH